MDRRDIIFRTDPGRSSRSPFCHTQVAFEIDNEDEGWSVLVVGHCEEVRSHHDMERTLAALDVHASEWVRIRATCDRRTSTTHMIPRKVTVHLDGSSFTEHTMPTVPRKRFASARACVQFLVGEVRRTTRGHTHVPQPDRARSRYEQHEPRARSRTCRRPGIGRGGSGRHSVHDEPPGESCDGRFSAVWPRSVVRDSPPPVPPWSAACEPPPSGRFESALVMSRRHKRHRIR